MEAIRICAVCGRVISEDDGWNIVNEGTDKNISSVIPATMQNGKATRSAFVQGVADGLLWICFTLKSLFPDTHSVPAPPAERILWKG